MVLYTAVFSYPTNEQYQIGGELIEEEVLEAVKVSLELLKELKIEANFQIANIKIPSLLVEKYGFSLG